jgi:hypothetical protein
MMPNVHPHDISGLFISNHVHNDCMASAKKTTPEAQVLTFSKIACFYQTPKQMKRT